MRPTGSTMLQQNNNNNYPCLNMSADTKDMIHKCSRASQPFPSRLELGLGDLPLIRGIRAWALCSRKCRKAPLGGQSPTAPQRSSTSCLRPADVYLSGEWSRIGYGLPLGQAGIGALVATLKTSESNGKTQTQCLFLQTENGSCLYSTVKPISGGMSSSASSSTGGWLRGKAGGGRDPRVPRRDARPTLQAQDGTNRVRSGLRWRKSGNTGGREKCGASRAKQHSSSEDPSAESTVRPERRDKGGLDIEGFPSPQQDSRRQRQEREGACRSPRSRHCASPKSQTGRKAQRRENHEYLRKQLKGEMKDEEGGISIVLNPDLTREEMNNTQRDDVEKYRDTNTEMMKVFRGGDSQSSRPESPCAANGVSDVVDDSEEGPLREDADRTLFETSIVSNCFVSSSTSSVVADASVPAGGSSADQDDEGLLEESRPGGGGGDPETGQGDVSRLEGTCVDKSITVNQTSQFLSGQEERDTSSSGLRHISLSVSVTDGRAERRDEDEEEVDEGGGAEEQCRPLADVKTSSAPNGDVRLLEPADGHTDLSADPVTSLVLCLANPAPCTLPLGATATSLPTLEAEEGRSVRAGEAGWDGRRRQGTELESPQQKQFEEDAEEEEEEEEEFGVFMHAGGEPAWSEGFATSASVPCGSVALGNLAITRESKNWTPSWTAGPFYQPDDTWAAFPQDVSDEGEDMARQWWPSSTEEDRREKQKLTSVFVEAFPSLPDSSSSDPPDTIPTLTQILSSRAGQDQGLLDGFHDLDKMIGHRYKRGGAMSRRRLLTTLQLESPPAESRAVPWSAKNRLSPGLPSANPNPQNAVA